MRLSRGSCWECKPQEVTRDCNRLSSSPAPCWVSHRPPPSCEENHGSDSGPVAPGVARALGGRRRSPAVFVSTRLTAASRSLVACRRPRVVVLPFMLVYTAVALLSAFLLFL